MKLTGPLEEAYSRERLSALEAQRKAQEIAFAPMVFQVSRLMLRFGILEHLSRNPQGVTLEAAAERAGLSSYAAQVLLEASLSIGTVLVREDRFVLSKTGWFLLNDKMVRVNLDFSQDVNYLGLFNLEASLLNGKPEGLKVFGDWPTIYEGLSSLPEQVRKSWFGFDHFYSDSAFPEALRLVFRRGRNVRRLLDVGGNTGRWASRCVEFDKDVEVTVLDLPQQLEMMREQTASLEGADRIHGYACNVLDEAAAFPQGFDAVWMSQFLDCFSEEQVIGICRRAAASMEASSRLYIMETFWDRQRFETAACCLTLTSVYFTAMANGNSKMYHSDDMAACVRAAGLEVEETVDSLGMGHSMMICRKK